MNWNWGKSIASVIILFILFCIGIIYITGSNQTSLVATDYYQQELNYDFQKLKINNGRIYQNQFLVSYNKESSTLSIQFPEINSTIHSTIHLYKPANAALDIIQEVQLDTTFVVAIPLQNKNADGLWRLKIDWNTSDKYYFNEIRLEL